MVGFALFQVQNALVNLLNANWVQGNTDGIKPTIGLKIDYTAMDLANVDYVFVGIDEETPGAFGIHSDDYISDVMIAMHVWTSQKGSNTSEYLHVQTIVNEVGRILKANPRYNNWARFLPKKVHSASDDERLVYHYVIDVLVTQVNP